MKNSKRLKDTAIKFQYLHGSINRGGLSPPYNKRNNSIGFSQNLKYNLSQIKQI